MKSIALGLLAALTLATPLLAGKFNKVINLGVAMPSFEKLEGIDGKKYSLSDFKKDVVVVAITCNHCSVATAYEDRMIEFAKKYADKVDFVAVNVTIGDEDGMPQMKERAGEKQFPYPYLADKSQKLGKALGAIATPEFFVLNKERKIVYMGVFDNNQKLAKVTKRYLEDAVGSVLIGDSPEIAETRPFGCTIEYKQ